MNLLICQRELAGTRPPTSWLSFASAAAGGSSGHPEFPHLDERASYVLAPPKAHAE